MHSDGASYFTGKNSGFVKLMSSRNITQVTGAPYTPQHQAKVERFFQTISKRANALRAAADLPPQYWEHSWRYAAKMWNYLDNGNTIHNASPVEVAVGKPHNEIVKSILPFGCKVIVTKDGNSTKEDKSKITWEGTYLGSGAVKGHHWVLDSRQNHRQIKLAYHIRPIDKVPQKMADNCLVNTGADDPEEIDLTTVLMYADPINGENNDTPTVNIAEMQMQLQPQCHPIPEVSDDQTDGMWQSEHTVYTLLQHESKIMGFEVHAAFVSNKIHYSKRAAYADNEGYMNSDAKELDNMHNNDVWEPVPITQLTPTEKEAMCRAHLLRYPKWSGSAGHRTLEKLKSRLVFDGRSQSYEQSGQYTASCTPRNSTINTHFGLAPLCKNEVNRKADITAAFLKAAQYTADGSACHVRLPIDMRQTIKQHGHDVEIVYKLKKSLYGQRNSPKQFEKLFAQWAVNEYGLIRSTVDPCIYYHKENKFRLLQFVDDSNVRGEPTAVQHFEQAFATRWDAEFEDCTYYLNMCIRRDEDGYCSLSQPAYAQDMLEKFDMTTARKLNTPLPTGTS